MQILAVVVVALLTVPLAGGRLARLADLRLRLIPVAVTMFAIQILIVNVIPGADIPHAAINIATYVVLGAVILANVRLPGIAVAGLGGLSNAAAIIANHGVMPAAAGALRAAGMEADPAAYTNSALVADARLAFLGDVFAIPASWPMSNVFSVGDVLLALGAAIVIHHTCGSRWTAWRSASRGEHRAGGVVAGNP
jgi:hypothetical protein